MYSYLAHFVYLFSIILYSIISIFSILIDYFQPLLLPPTWFSIKLVLAQVVTLIIV